MIILYTTHCPQCQLLEARLKEKKIQYDVCTNQDLMIEKGFRSVPVLEVNGEALTFASAMKWVANR